MTILSIIIPAKNEEKFLPLLIKSLHKQFLKNIEIIVADANSTDSTRKIAKKLGCLVVEGGPPDIGRNNGARKAFSSLFCFIDSDVIINKRHFLEKAVKEFHDKKLDVATVLMEPIKTGNTLNDFLFKLFYGIANNSILHAENSKRPLMQNVMFSKANVFKKIKGFPPYEFGEDSAFSESAVKKGYKFGVLKSPGTALISPRRFLGKDGSRRRIFSTAVKASYFNVMRFFGHEFIRGKTRMKYF